MRRALLLLALAVPAGPALAQSDIAVLRGLDKITARIATIEVPIGEAARFGTLEITARRCHERPPEEPPEKTAYLEIRDLSPGRPTTDLFAGWMFASSPAVSALEHPVYDVWVIDCRNFSSSERSSAGSNEAERSSAASSSRR